MPALPPHPETIWLEAIKTVKQTVPEDHWGYFDDIAVLRLEDSTLYLKAATSRAYLNVTGFYSQEVHRALSKVAPGMKWDLCSPDSPATASAQEQKVAQTGQAICGLWEQHEFSNFVVGSCNERARNFAHSFLNPLRGKQMGIAGSNHLLLFYGRSGVGKTHLLHAMGNEAMALLPGAKVLCLSAHEFFQQMQESLNSRKIRTFRKKYQDLDLLLLDDIQHLKNMQRTQEELVQIYGNLVESGRGLMALSSSVEPASLKFLSRDLRARLRAGLAVRLERPDHDTLLGILRQQEEIRGFRLSDECSMRVVQAARDARYLQGVLNHIQMSLHIEGKYVAPTVVQEALRQQGAFSRHPTPDEILQAVSESCAVTIPDMCSKGRGKQIVFARHVAMYLMRQLTEKSLPGIGEYMGGRDHSTVVHACKKISDLIEVDARVRDLVRDLMDGLLEG